MREAACFYKGRILLSGALFPVRFLGKQPLAQEFGRVPGGNEAQDEDDGCDSQRVEQFEPHGIGVGDEHSLRVTQFQEPVLLGRRHPDFAGCRCRASCR